MKTQTKERKMMAVEYKMLRDLRKELTALGKELNIVATISAKLDFDMKNLQYEVQEITSHISTTPKKKFKYTN